jgi:hypothetical protein
MNTVTIVTVRGKIGHAKFPADDSLLHILSGEDERKFTAYCFAYIKPALAIDICFLVKSVFVIFRVLIHKSESAFNELLNKPFCNLFFSLIQFFYCGKPFLIEKFDECIKKRGRFHIFCCIGANTVVSILALRRYPYEFSKISQSVS